MTRRASCRQGRGLVFSMFAAHCRPPHRPHRLGSRNMIKEYTYLWLRLEWLLLVHYKEISRTLHSCVCFFGIMTNGYGQRQQQRRRRLSGYGRLILMTSLLLVYWSGRVHYILMNRVKVFQFFTWMCGLTVSEYFISGAWVVIGIYPTPVSCVLAL